MVFFLFTFYGNYYTQRFITKAKFYLKATAIILLVGFFLVRDSYSQSANIKFTASPKKVFGVEQPLVGITDAVIISDDSFAILTATYPAIHIFEDGSHRSWGKEGNGPDAFDNPAHLEINGETLFALDFRPGACKIISYSLQGEYIASKPIRGAGMCYKFRMSRSRKIVETGSWGSRQKELLLVDKGLKELTNFMLPEAVTLLTPNGPMRRFSLQNPFANQPAWELSAAGNLIFWNGEDNELMIFKLPNLDKKGSIPIPENDIKITEDAVDNWVNKSFPAGKALFGKPDFYRSVRKNIKKELSIPETYPLLNKIISGPNGGIWILRAYYRSDGQVWSYISPSGEPKYTVTFPKEREILAFGRQHIIATYKNENGEEFLEIYNRNSIFD